MKKDNTKTNKFLYCLLLPMRSTPFIYIMYLAFNLICALFPTLEIILWKNILDSIQSIVFVDSMYSHLILLFVMYMLVSISVRLAESIKNVIEVRLVEKIQLYVDLEIMQQYNKLDAEYFDNPTNMDNLDVVKNSKMTISEGVLWPAKIIKSLGNFILVAGVFFVFSPIVAVVYIIFSLPQAISTMKLETDLNQNDINSMLEQRRKEYNKSILIDKKYAKDTRIYESKKYFTDKYCTEWRKILQKKHYIYKTSYIKIYRNELLHSFGYLFAIISTLVKAINGSISIGDISIILNATKSCSGAFNELFDSYSQFVKVTSKRVELYINFLEMEPSLKNGSLICPMEFEVEFRNVFFKYPTEKDYTLEDISFQIKPGTKNAIVGKNGEGKSTIIKLLLRLYDPDKGIILIDGIDIKEYDLVNLRARFSSCFQEVPQYALTVEENITFLENGINISELDYAADFSGIKLKVDSFGSGYKTELTKEFSLEGEELSGGQWQQLAITRALYRKSNFLVMDEPSSALDPLTEDNVMNLLSVLSEDRTNIIVSHRLSNLQKYDQIIVLNNKTIEEIGTHDILISNEKLYAKMYRLQSQKYKEAQA